MSNIESKPSVISGAADHIANILTSVCAVILAVISIIVVISVFFRYCLGDALSWTEEASRFLVVYVGLIGAAIALYKNDHAAVTSFVGLLPSFAQKICRVASCLLIGIFSAIMIVYGFRLAFYSGARADILPIPMWIPLLSVPLSGMVIFLTILLRLISELRR
jgi:TRAP-type C4-dicarboxylate transport system permease small subunit